MHYYFEALFRLLSFLDFFSLNQPFLFLKSNDVNSVDLMAYAGGYNFLIFN